MKKIIATLCLVLALTFSVTAFGCAGKSKDRIVDVTTKTITVGYTEYEPMNFEDKGVLKGFDTELALMVFNALGYDVRFKLIEWSNKYLELDGGTIDCIWNGFTANSSDNDTPRDQLVDFSAYYMENNQCVIRKNGTPEINEESQFDGMSIAYENGSAGEGYVDTLTGNINKKGVTAQLDALRQVNMGTAQYAVVDRTLAENYVGQGDYSSLVINESVTIPVEYYAIGFRKGSDLTAKVNVMLYAFQQTGQLEELANKYNLATRLMTITL